MERLELLGYDVSQVEVSWLQRQGDESYFYRIGYVSGRRCYIAQDCITYLQEYFPIEGEAYTVVVEAIALVIIMHNNTYLELDLIIKTVDGLLSGKYANVNGITTIGLSDLIDELKKVCDNRTVKLPAKRYF